MTPAKEIGLLALLTFGVACVTILPLILKDFKEFFTGKKRKDDGTN